MPWPYLVNFSHDQVAASGSDDTVSFNGLLDDIGHSILIGVRPEGQDISTTATAYPGTPDLRFTVTPWAGKYAVVQARMRRSAGAGTFRLKWEIEGPVGTKNTGGILSHSSGTSGNYIGNIDLSSLGGADRRGDDGFLNIYLEVDAGTTGVLEGLSAFQAEDVAGNTYLMW